MNILFTGCGSSFGAYIRERLMERGHKIYGVGLDGPDLKLDFTASRRYTENEKNQAVHRIFNLAEQHVGGPIDILINNAAITRIDFLAQHSFDDFEDTVYVNLTIPFMLCREFVSRIQNEADYSIPDDAQSSTPYRKIINTSTMGTKIALRASPGYCASKAGLEMMTKVIAKEAAGNMELAAVCICPNGVEDGGMTEYTLKQMMRTRGWTYEECLKYNRNNPFGRNMHFDELAVLYLYVIETMPIFYSGTIFTAPGGNGL